MNSPIRKQEQTYTKEERAKIIAAMVVAKNDFYKAAVAIGNHPFIEFAGLMHKYIDICRQNSNEGTDFTEASIHSGKPLTVFDHDVTYLAEKFSCIFGPTFTNNTELWAEFVSAVESSDRH